MATRKTNSKPPARKSVLGENPFANAAEPRAPASERRSAKPTKKAPAATAKPKQPSPSPVAEKPRPTKKARPARAQTPTPTTPEPTSSAHRRRPVDDQIHEFERQFERGPAPDDSHDLPYLRATMSSSAAQSNADDEGGAFDVARELLSTDFYLRQWGRIGMRNRSETVDGFGHDPKYDARIRPILDFLYTRYFRASTEGIENVPSEGPALLVVNHSGTFPYDGVMLKTALRREHAAHRELRWLAEDFTFYLPFVGSFLNRMGAVRACPENAERLLRQRRLVAVFPEGAKGTGRLYRDRYKLQRFGRGGFIRLCLRTRTPVIPCVIIGAEESMPLLYRIEYLSNLLGVPYIPITPTFPLLGAVGVIPAPTRWSFIFGDPIAFEGYGPEAADDRVLVGRLAERVRATMQGMIDRAVASRRSVWLGI